MIIDCISDLIGFYPKLDGGDLLIVAGNLTARDKTEEYTEFGKWIKSQNYRKKIVICGNHDEKIYKSYQKSLLPDFLGFIAEQFNPFMLYGCEYLCDSGTEFHGTDKDGNSYTMKIWGSPWSLTFPGMNPKCKAFTVDTEEELAEKWALIPDDIDILVTHGPAYGIFDEVYLEEYSRDGNYTPVIKENVGSKSLYEKLMILPKVKLAIWGHIHESYGQGEMLTECKEGWNKCIVANASHVNERYQPVNPAIRVLL